MSPHLPDPLSPNKSRVYKALIEQFDLLLRAKNPLIYRGTGEEEPVEYILTEVALQSSPSLTLMVWDIGRGWSENKDDKATVMGAFGRIVQREKAMKARENVILV